MRSYTPDLARVPIPHPVHTVAEGYPVAAQMKDGRAPGTALTSAQVYLKRNDRGFEVDTITYCFVSTAGQGRTFVVVLVNPQLKAFVGADRSGIQRHPFFPGGESQPLVISQIDVPQVLQIADTNGLKEFAARAPGPSGEVTLTLGSSRNGPSWLVTGSGWDDKEDVEGLHLEIDAQTGAVLSKSPEKSAQRQQLK